MAKVKKHPFVSYLNQLSVNHDSIQGQCSRFSMNHDLSFHP